MFRVPEPVLLIVRPSSTVKVTVRVRVDGLSELLAYLTARTAAS